MDHRVDSGSLHQSAPLTKQRSRRVHRPITRIRHKSPPRDPELSSDSPRSGPEICPGCSSQLLPRINSCQTPMILPCLHTVCAACCTSKERLHCPVCGHGAHPSEPLVNFPAIRRIQTKVVTSGGALICDNCEQLHASWRCGQCAQFLCGACRDSHLRIKVR